MSDNIPRSSQETTGNNNAPVPNEATPATNADATALLVGPSSSNRTSQDKICIGILYSKQDLEIAKRFKAEFEKHTGVKALLFYHDYSPPPGGPKVDEIVGFGQHCDGFIWIATENSVNDFEMEHQRAICHFQSLKAEGKKFMCGIPAENLNIKIPNSLDAYTPITEDERFFTSVLNTVEYMIRKLTRPDEARPSIQQPRENQRHRETTSTPPIAQPSNNNQPAYPNEPSGAETSEENQSETYNIHLTNAVIHHLQIGGEFKYSGSDNPNKTKITFPSMKTKNKEKETDIPGDDPDNSDEKKETDIPGDDPDNSDEKQDTDMPGDDPDNSGEKKEFPKTDGCESPDPHK